MEQNDIIYLYPVSDSDVGALPRSRTPAEQRILYEKGEALMSKATIALLYHGTLTPDGDPATLIVVDFRFLPSSLTRRFRKARMRLAFRDTSGSTSATPIVYRIAPEDRFSIEPGEDIWEIKKIGNIGVGGSVAGVSVEGSVGIEKEGKKKIKHSILLTGKKKLEIGGYLGETSAVWNLEEDKVEERGIPTVLRTAVLLKRQPSRSFGIKVELETEVNFRAKLQTFWGNEEHCVPLEDIEVNPEEATHIVIDGDENFAAWVEKANEEGKWENLAALRLQDELVIVANEKLMACNSRLEP
ncbi:hypothetical protein F4803DRAFT_516568 [Xylaria telfairii]|nr:hypothetical protein F4803DRAFT_516568 [Xylaria telfairii]